jgi:hypothetical protein
VSEELEEMVNGIILLGISNEAVWTYHIEGQDVYSLGKFCSVSPLIVADLRRQRGIRRLRASEVLGSVSLFGLYEFDSGILGVRRTATDNGP